VAFHIHEQAVAGKLLFEPLINRLRVAGIVVAAVGDENVASHPAGPQRVVSNIARIIASGGVERNLPDRG
jgi:hypothetical protein